MSNFALSINGNLALRGCKARRASRNLAWLGSRSLKLILISMVFVFGLAYFIEVNNLATKGFTIQELEKIAASIKDENKQLDIQVAEFQSSSNLETKIADLKMVAVGKVDYLTPTGGAVARAD